MQRMIALLTALLLALGLTAGAALAHHDLVGGPPNNPHTLGVPQEFWEEGLEAAFILAADLDGEPEFHSVDELPPPWARPAVVDPEAHDSVELDFPEVFWLVVRIGADDADLRAIRFELGVPTPEYGILESRADDFDADDVIDAETEEPTVEGDQEGDFMWLQSYPHPHSLILHEGTPRERCVDLANARDIGNPNQHNAMHIGQPGTRAFANAGHVIVPATCEDQGF